ncbi:MAG: DUF2304 domain-containing protein [Armatimonadota bacterium]|jgi:hypothetical protein
MTMMEPRQAAFTVLMALALFIFVVELVRRRRLREEYSWLWVLATAMTLALVSWDRALAGVIRLSGASKATTVIFMLAIAFLAVVCVHLCVKLTEVSSRMQKLAQKTAIMGMRRPGEAPSPDGEASARPAAAVGDGET